jgi:hypothetical protein
VGTRSIVFSRADFLPDSQRVTVRFNERTTAKATLTPCGYLDIQVTPSTANVTLDGRVLSVDQRRLMLPLGRYRLTIAAADYDTVRRTVTIAHGQTILLREALASIFGGVRITSSPTGATLTSTPAGIRGVTPLANDRVLPGSYHVRLETTGRLPGDVIVPVQKGQTATIHVNLPENPDIIRMRNARIKSRARVITFALGVVAAGIGAKWGVDASSAYDERNTAFENYQSATTSTTAAYWRDKHTSAEQRGDSAARKRNVSFGAAGALLGASIVLTVR